ncbi:MAG: anti-sigma factor [Gemmatimonadales bacterium]
MSTHDWFVEHRALFVARSLDPEEENTFRAHLPGCPECREEIARLERELAWLPMDVAPVSPRPGLSRQITDHVLGVNHWRWNRLTTLAVAASLLLAVLAYGAGRREQGRLRAALGQQQATINALSDTLSIMKDARKVLQASIQMGDHTGGIMIFADDRTHRWNVVVHGLPPVGPSEVYQFWFIRKDGMVRGAELHMDPARPAFMTLSMPAGNLPVLGAALTVEPMDEKSDHPQGKELAHLML